MREKVIIKHSDEISKLYPVFAVCKVDDTDLWYASFDTLDHAKRYCNVAGYEIEKIVCEVQGCENNECA